MNNEVVLSDVARAAGVAESTVSLVLSGKGDRLRISSKTQARIRTLAGQMGYQPHQPAREVALGHGVPHRAPVAVGAPIPVGSPRGRVVGVIFSDTSPRESFALLPDAVSTLVTGDYRLAIVQVPAGPLAVHDGVNQFLAEGVCGMLCCATLYAAVLEAAAGRAPVIVLWRGGAKALLAKMSGSTEVNEPVAAMPPVASAIPAPKVVSAAAPAAAPAVRNPVETPTPVPSPAPVPVTPVAASRVAEPEPDPAPVKVAPVVPPVMPPAQEIKKQEPEPKAEELKSASVVVENEIVVPPPVIPEPAPEIVMPEPMPEPIPPAPVVEPSPVAEVEPIDVPEPEPVASAAADPNPEPAVVVAPEPEVLPQPEPEVAQPEPAPEPVPVVVEAVPLPVVEEKQVAVPEPVIATPEQEPVASAAAEPMPESAVVVPSAPEVLSQPAPEILMPKPEPVPIPVVMEAVPVPAVEEKPVIVPEPAVAAPDPVPAPEPPPVTDEVKMPPEGEGALVEPEVVTEEPASGELPVVEESKPDNDAKALI